MGNGENIVIFYRHVSDFQDIFTQGHEETHALHMSGRLDLLQEKLDEANLDINIRGYAEWDGYSISNNPYVADIGGMLALHRKGDGVENVLNRLYGSPPINFLSGTLDFKKALREKNSE